jgi:hypothetical protein
MECKWEVVIQFSSANYYRLKHIVRNYIMKGMEKNKVSKYCTTDIRV